jgi:hypothetical protein
LFFAFVLLVVDVLVTALIFGYSAAQTHPVTIFG